MIKLGSNGVGVILIALQLSLSTVTAYPGSFGNDRSGARQVTIKATDPFDHFWVDAWASIGDSYSVGIGAGHTIKSSDNVELNPGSLTGGYCYQYSQGYPNILNSDDLMGYNPNRKFQYLGCSGALVPDITKNQVPLLKSPQVVTISAGGNDAELATILNYCVYQWSAKWGWSCDGVNSVLEHAKNTINSDDYATNLKTLVEDVKAKLADDSSRIYWTAYSKFFDESTKDCDDVTWSFSYNYGFRQYLSQDRRIKMNDLVALVNQKIAKACSDAGPKCVYVESSADFDAIKGRFCEPGVNEMYEGSAEGRDREQTGFYEWSTTKDDDTDHEKGDKQTKRDIPPGGLSNSTFEGAIANWIKLGKDNNGADDMNLTAANLPDGEFTTQGLPDSISRVFHLTKFANDIVAQNVLNAMAVEQGKIMNQPAASATITGCPAPTGTDTSRGQQNRCRRDEPDPDNNPFTVDDGNKAIVDFCNKYKGQVVGSGSAFLGDRFSNGDDTATTIVISMEKDTTPTCQSIPDAGVWSVPECRDNLSSAMNNCDTDTTAQKLGGKKETLCIVYSISGSKSPLPNTKADPPKPSAPFQTGTCGIHVHQYRNFNGGSPFDDSDTIGYPYSLEAAIYDNQGTQIGKADLTKAMDGHSLKVKSKLENPLVLTPEESGGEYIQFGLGSAGWASNNKGNSAGINANCKVGDWDGGYDRQMDCSFACGWNGGPSSDAS